MYLKLFLPEAFSAKNAPNIVLRLGHIPEPAGDLTVLPRPPSWMKGSLLLRKGVLVWREGKGMGWGGPLLLLILDMSLTIATILLQNNPGEPMFSQGRD